MRTQIAEDFLSAEAIRASLTTEFIGHNVVYRPSVTSTNDLARALAAQGAPEGTLVLAEEQTAGRGRLGRAWLAPRGPSLRFSLIFRPVLPPGQAFRLAMLCSLAAARAIEAVTALPIRLKWPNDLVLRGKKLGGVLSESSLTGERLDFVVVGLGLNVNLDVSTLPEIAATATSLSTELGRPVARLPLLQRILREIETGYQDVIQGEALRAAWAARLSTLGQMVRVSGGTEDEGLAEGVDADGALLLRRADGTLARITVGDVTLRPTG
jgi:BirA family biotin operon repressor/biotin-[acetyl-CoA-carboxylase] ligase